MRITPNFTTSFCGRTQNVQKTKKSDDCKSVKDSVDYFERGYDRLRTIDNYLYENDDIPPITIYTDDDAHAMQIYQKEMDDFYAQIHSLVD